MDPLGDRSSIAFVASNEFPRGVVVCLVCPEALLGLQEIRTYARASREEVLEWVEKDSFPAWSSRGKWRSSRSAIDDWFRHRHDAFLCVERETDTVCT